MTAPALCLVVMGPSGCGKTTLALALAQAFELEYVEGDDLHPPANVEKMRSGCALDDRDREPWLDAVGAALQSGRARGVVASCSALKRRYRDRLRSVAGRVWFVLPGVPREILAQRLAARTGHFMPPRLLDSQLADLEPLGTDEEGIGLDGTASLQSQVESIRRQISARP